MQKYIKEIHPIELSFCGGAVSFLQSDFWGSFKARFGWKPFPFSIELGSPGSCEDTGISAGSGSPEKLSIPLLVLYRRLGFGIGFAYIPWGPEFPDFFDAEDCVKAAKTLASGLRGFLPKDTAFIRFDFPFFVDDLNINHGDPRSTIEKLLENAAFSRAAADVQPPDSVLVGLAGDEAAILGAMKPKWRYNIGLAEKKGVKVRSVNAGSISTENGAADLAGYYKIYRETAARDGISIHGIEYYRVLFEEAAKHGIDARLYMASHEGEDIAGIVTLFRGTGAVYLYGASSNNKRNLMAPYALQWKAMQDAKVSGCSSYDMFGIPPKPQEDDPGHPMAGLYRFKTGFSGNIIHRPGSWDYSCRPLAKTLFLTAEKTRKKIWDLKKRLKRR